MKKFYFLLFLLASNYTIIKAQSIPCARPLCGEIFPDPDDVVKNNKLNVYPNPSKGKINLELHQNSATNAFLIIRRMNGKNISNQAIELNSQTETFSFDLSDKKKGWYIVTIKSDEGIHSTKVLITR